MRDLAEVEVDSAAAALDRGCGVQVAVGGENDVPDREVGKAGDESG